MKKLSKIKEEFSAGIGNTQAPNKKEFGDKKKKLSSFKKKKLADGSSGKVMAAPPSTNKGDTDTQPPIGGE